MTAAVKGSAIRALRKGQKAFLSNFLSLKSVLTATLARVLPADPFTEFSSLSNRIPRDSREGDPFSQPSGSSAGCADACLINFRTERSGLNDSSLGSFRSGFLGRSSLNQARSFSQADSCSPHRAHPAARRDQKTFSAAPRSFRLKRTLGLREQIHSALAVQPFFDSRLGRITFKALPGCTLNLWKAAASNQSQGAPSHSTPLLAHGCSQIFVYSFFIASSGNIRFSS